MISNKEKKKVDNKVVSVSQYRIYIKHAPTHLYLTNNMKLLKLFKNTSLQF